MDQAEPENQIIYWYQQECGYDTDLDCVVCLSASGLYKVPIETKEKYATDADDYCSLIYLKNEI